MNKTLIAVALLAVSFSFAQAPQPPQGPAWGSGARGSAAGQPLANPAERLAVALKLDAAKTEQAKKILDQLRLDREKIGIALARKKLDLKEATLGGNYDMEKIKKHCDESAKLMSDMHLLGFVADMELKKILTPDQWSQYQQIRKMMQARHEGMRKGRMHGGPDRGPHGPR